MYQRRSLGGQHQDDNHRRPVALTDRRPSTRPPRVEGRRCLPAKSLSMCSEDAGLIGATSPPMDLTTIYAPIQDELSRLHRLLAQELAADAPFVSELVR